jgi:hypothetical protein
MCEDDQQQPARLASSHRGKLLAGPACLAVSISPIAKCQCALPNDPACVAARHIMVVLLTGQQASGPVQICSARQRSCDAVFCINEDPCTLNSMAIIHCLRLLWLTVHLGITTSQHAALNMREARTGIFACFTPWLHLLCMAVFQHQMMLHSTCIAFIPMGSLQQV